MCIIITIFNVTIKDSIDKNKYITMNVILIIFNMQNKYIDDILQMIENK